MGYQDPSCQAKKNILKATGSQKQGEGVFEPGGRAFWGQALYCGISILQAGKP
jgi:hypothetical protein